jgi:probable F420-dependent oxidoreductase
VTVPFDGVPGDVQSERSLVERLVELGYTDLWSSEVNGSDAFTPLALASTWTPTARLGTAIASAFTRGPALLAMSAAALARAAPGRFVLGIGSSSNVVVESWNGMRFHQPYTRTRDVLRFLRVALTGEKVDQNFDSFTIRGFRLTTPPAVPPPILVAALRPRMLRLAGREGDGALINWLAVEDVPKVVGEVGEDKEIVARIFVVPIDDAAEARRIARFAIAAYLNVPVYASFHEWLGRGPALEAMWSAWRAGDRRASSEAIPDAVVDALVVHGSSATCRAQIERYVDAGVTTPVLSLLSSSADSAEALTQLAPRSPA